MKNLMAVPKALYVAAAGVVILLLTTYLGLDGFPRIISSRISAAIALNNGTAGMEAFRKMPAPMQFKVYLFNLTNPDEVTRGAQPVVEEVGPYVYDLYKEKIDIEMDDETDTISYRLVKRYAFNKNRSGCYRPSDIITFLNVPLMGLVTKIEETFPMGLGLLDAAAPLLFPDISSPFTTATVGEFLFDGVRINCSHKTGPSMPICQGIGRNIPKSFTRIPDSTDFAFSLFQQNNNTPSGVYKVLRGNKNIYDLGRILEYDNRTYLEVWDRNSSCSKIKGTDSTIVSPIRDPRESVYIFLSEMCLSLKAVNTESTTLYDIPVYRYVASLSNFESGYVQRSNLCRCKKANGKHVCLKTGAIDASKCTGAPVIFTYPHILYGDEEYQNFVKGYNRDPAKHQTEVYIEPKTGIPVGGFKRVQMNMFLKKVQDMEILANVSEGLFPLFWAEESLTEELVNSFLPQLSELMNTDRIVASVTGLMAGVGLFCLVVALILHLKRRPCHSSEKHSPSERITVQSYSPN